MKHEDREKRVGENAEEQDRQAAIERAGGQPQPDRRRFLRDGTLVAGGFIAAYSAPSVAAASQSSCMSPVDLPLPFSFSGPVPGGPQRVVFPGDLTYDFQGSVSISIDEQGTISVDDVAATGTFVSGANPVGEITIVQDGSATGALKGTKVQVPEIPILYSDESNTDVPGTMTVDGSTDSCAMSLLTGVSVPGIGNALGDDNKVNIDCCN